MTADKTDPELPRTDAWDAEEAAQQRSVAPAGARRLPEPGETAMHPGTGGGEPTASSGTTSVPAETEPNEVPQSSQTGRGSDAAPPADLEGVTAGGEPRVESRDPSDIEDELGPADDVV